jgi:hypothetical protein
MRVQVIVVSPHTHVTYNWEQGIEIGRREDGDKKRDGFYSTSVSQCQKQNREERRSMRLQMRAIKHCKNGELITCRRNNSNEYTI